MNARCLGLCFLLVVALTEGCHPCLAQAPDDPFYDWDLERYRLFRSPEDPTGGILPLPDPSVEWKRPARRMMGFWAEAAGVDSSVAAPGGDGRRIQDGVHARFGIDYALALPYSICAHVAGRLLDAAAKPPIAGDGDAPLAQAYHQPVGGLAERR